MKGQAIAIVIVFAFVCVFFLREWVVQNARLGFFDNPAPGEEFRVDMVQDPDGAIGLQEQEALMKELEEIRERRALELRRQEELQEFSTSAKPLSIALRTPLPPSSIGSEPSSAHEEESPVDDEEDGTSSVEASKIVANSSPRDPTDALEEMEVSYELTNADPKSLPSSSPYIIPTPDIRDPLPTTPWIMTPSESLPFPIAKANMPPYISTSILSKQFKRIPKDITDPINFEPLAAEIDNTILSASHSSMEASQTDPVLKDTAQISERPYHRDSSHISVPTLESSSTSQPSSFFATPPSPRSISPTRPSQPPAMIPSFGERPASIVNGADFVTNLKLAEIRQSQHKPRKSALETRLPNVNIFTPDGRAHGIDVNPARANSSSPTRVRLANSQLDSSTSELPSPEKRFRGGTQFSHHSTKSESDISITPSIILSEVQLEAKIAGDTSPASSEIIRPATTLFDSDVVQSQPKFPPTIPAPSNLLSPSGISTPPSSAFQSKLGQRSPSWALKGKDRENPIVIPATPEVLRKRKITGGDRDLFDPPQPSMAFGGKDISATRLEEKGKQGPSRTGGVKAFEHSSTQNHRKSSSQPLPILSGSFDFTIPRRPDSNFMPSTSNTFSSSFPHSSLVAKPAEDSPTPLDSTEILPTFTFGLKGASSAIAPFSFTAAKTLTPNAPASKVSTPPPSLSITSPLDTTNYEIIGTKSDSPLENLGPLEPLVDSFLIDLPEPRDITYPSVTEPLASSSKQRPPLPPAAGESNTTPGLTVYHAPEEIKRNTVDGVAIVEEEMLTREDLDHYFAVDDEQVGQQAAEAPIDQLQERDIIERLDPPAQALELPQPEHEGEGNPPEENLQEAAVNEPLGIDDEVFDDDMGHALEGTS